MGAANVLVVEDQRELWGLIKEGLSEDEYKIQFAQTIEGGKRKLDNDTYQAVVIDLNLDNKPLGGLEVIEHCMKVRPFAKCVVLTSKQAFKGDENERIIQCFEAGAFRWVYKQSDGNSYIDKLRKKIKEAVDHYSVENGGLVELKQLYSNRLGCPIHSEDGAKCIHVAEILNKTSGYSDSNVFMATPYHQAYEDRQNSRFIRL